MKTVKVVAAIIHRDGKIFATARGYGDFKGGWFFAICGCIISVGWIMTILPVL